MGVRPAVITDILITVTQLLVVVRDLFVMVVTDIVVVVTHGLVVTHNDIGCNGSVHLQYIMLIEKAG